MQHKNIDSTNKIIDIVIFGLELDVQLGGSTLKINCPKLMNMYGFKHYVSLSFSEVSKTPRSNQTITSHKTIYNIFDSGIYHKTQ